VKNWGSANQDKQNALPLRIFNNNTIQDKNQASQAIICAGQGYGGEQLKGIGYAFLSASYGKNYLYLK
jgi:hypothetical protein